jgi:hypothetical protein
VNVFEQFLNDRDDSSGGKNDDELLVWLNQGNAPEVRLLKFDAWVGRQLANRLDWTWAGAAKAKRIEQCRVYLERLVLEMWRRGWMLDGKRLAAHIESVLDSIGAYQRAGKVVEFWPYFRACVDRYVGANAEEIRAEAMRVGSHAGQLLSALGVKKAAGGPSLPELVAQRADEVTKAKDATLRDKLARQREREAARKADATAPRLL